MSVRYSLVENEFRSEEGQGYRSFGIVLVQDQEVLKRVEDISLNKTFVEEAVELFNRYELSAVHLEEVIENLLAWE